MILILCAQYTSCANIRRESHIGTDPISAICFGQVRIYAGHAIGKNWSADTGICLNLKRLTSGRSSMEKRHWNTLYGYETEVKKLRENLIISNVSFSFWPEKPYSGAVFSIGGRIADRTHPDMTAGIGYFCTICKGLRIGIEYRLRICECLEKRELPTDGLKASIGYAF